MKQKVNGQRVINWHRPFRKGEDLSQRYLRLKDEPLMEDLAQTTDESDEFRDHKSPCSCPICEKQYFENWAATTYQQAKQEASQLLFPSDSNDLASLVPPSLWNQLRSREEEESESQTAPLRRDRVTALDLPHILGSYFINFSENNQQRPSPKLIQTLKKELKNLTVRNKIAQLVENHPQFLSAVSDLLVLQPFWIRDLRHWRDSETDPERRLISLASHLLVEYEVPEFFWNDWKKGLEIYDTDWLKWFLLWTRGVSIHRTSDNFGWQFPKKFMQRLAEAPAHLDFEWACVWAEMKRLNVPDSAFEYELLRGYNEYSHPPLRSASDDPFIIFQKNSLIWIARHQHELSREQIFLILEWAENEYYERINPGKPNFSLTGRSVARALEASTIYDIDQNGPLEHRSWINKGWDWEYNDEEDNVWTFTELTTSKDLRSEGLYMNHCSLDYAAACHQQKSAFFSMKFNDQRKATIEVDPGLGTVTESHGKANSQVAKTSRRILNKWLTVVVSQNPWADSPQYAISA